MMLQAPQKNQQHQNKYTTVYPQKPMSFIVVVHNFHQTDLIDHSMDKMISCLYCQFKHIAEHLLLKCAAKALPY